MPSTMDLDNPVPDLLLRRMGELGHTQAQAARAMHTTSTALSKITSRKSGLGVELAPRVAKYLGITNADLYRLAGLMPDDEPVNAPADDDILTKRLRRLFAGADDELKNHILDVVRVVIDAAAPRKIGRKS